MEENVEMVYHGCLDSQGEVMPRRRRNNEKVGDDSRNKSAKIPAKQCNTRCQGDVAHAWVREQRAEDTRPDVNPQDAMRHRNLNRFLVEGSRTASN